MQIIPQTGFDFDIRINTGFHEIWRTWLILFVSQPNKIVAVVVIMVMVVVVLVVVVVVVYIINVFVIVVVIAVVSETEL